MPASDGRHRTPRDIVPGFAATVKRKREDRGMSLHDLAKITGLGATTICCVEKEWRAPSLRVAVTLAQALGIDTPLPKLCGKIAPPVEPTVKLTPWQRNEKKKRRKKATA